MCGYDHSQNSPTWLQGSPSFGAVMGQVAGASGGSVASAGPVSGMAPSFCGMILPLSDPSDPPLSDPSDEPLSPAIGDWFSEDPQPGARTRNAVARTASEARMGASLRKGRTARPRTKP